jgi:pyrophosphate--fructose-6-phosphate 1-phosphotransferase
MASNNTDGEKPTLAAAAPLLSKSVYLRSQSAVSGQDVHVAMMTSGGLAPCLSASIASLTKFWIKAYRDGEINGLTLRMYKDGYKGVLTGDSFIVPESDWDRLVHLEDLGGSPIGNSRVKVRRR